MTEVTSTNLFELNRQKIIDFFASGKKERGTCQIGLELEQFVIDENDETVTYETGIKDLLEQLGDYYAGPKDRPLIIDDQLMGYVGEINLSELVKMRFKRFRDELSEDLHEGEITEEEYEGVLLEFAETEKSQLELYKDRDPIQVSITLEPASQLEISVGPCTSASECIDGVTAFLSQVYNAIQELDKNWYLLRMGYNPVQAAHELPLINKSRYRMMDAHFKKTGKHGIDMMRGSASTQISIDYTDEQSFLDRYRLAVALGPVFAAITDNARAPKTSSLAGVPRMVRSHIWRDTDPARCGIVPGTFEEGFGFAAYADWLMDIPAILMTDENGNSYSTGDKTIGQLISERPITKRDIEHLISMVFPDVRLKNFIELRDVDSLPPVLAGAYAALVRGIFYYPENLKAAQELIELDKLTDQTVYDARTNLMNGGYQATVYGMPLQELALKLIALAENVLPSADRELLEPLKNLVDLKVTQFEMMWEPPTMRILDREYRQIIEDLDGDIEGRKVAQKYLDDSYAIRDGKTIPWTFTPKLYTSSNADYLGYIAEKTVAIMEKATHEYLTNPEFRKLFGFSPELEELTLMETGYEENIPLARVDIFFDEDTQDFKFCELNTDGSSGMVFMRETNEALKLTDTFQLFADRYELSEYPIFEHWSSHILDVYDEFAENTGHPHGEDVHVAMVDYKESVMFGETQLYASEYFGELHGVDARFVDIRDLVYEDGELKDRTDGWRIDCIWRRAVTSEMMEKFVHGAQAMIDAAKDMKVCLVGSFRTHPAGVKDFLPILTSDAGKKFLTPEEHAFMVEHTPATRILDETIDFVPILARPKNYIVKPRDGYGGVGVYAGKDFRDSKSWEKLVREKAFTGGYVVQEYITPYKTDELLPTVETEADIFNFEPYDNLVGLYVFGGRFGGIFSRGGKNNTITSHTGGVNLPTFVVEDDGQIETLKL